MDEISIYLDVDGVVSPFGPRGTTDWGTKWQYGDAGALEVMFAAELVRELNRISRHPGVRFVWLTSWEELAPRYLCPAIGLDGHTWPVLGSVDADPGLEWWKLEAIQRDIEASAPDRAVWIDDQLGYEGPAMAWAAMLGERMLGISPDPRRGLTRADVAAIKEFLAPRPGAMA
ncbi:HAD domain-containing protein [Pseudarthrobacter sp. P1]|uniref:HAD domain-containing protein n=1 Tax=Pseudarthrobacter sp. P1 TaxID=3418418 RepID=UPI003CF0C18A